MVLIFKQTTTYIAAEFINLFSEEFLTACLDKVAREAGLKLNASHRTFNGDFNSILLAHKNLENVLQENSPRTESYDEHASSGIINEIKPIDQACMNYLPNNDRTNLSENSDNGRSDSVKHFEQEKDSLCHVTHSNSNSGRKDGKQHETDGLKQQSGNKSTTKAAGVPHIGNDDKHNKSQHEIDINWIKQENEPELIEDTLDEDKDAGLKRSLGSGALEKELSQFTKPHEKLKNPQKARKGKKGKKEDEENEYKCGICSFTSKGKNKKRNLLSHIARLHRKIHSCDLCEKQFGYMKDLNRHKTVHHSNLTYTCDKCDKVYRTKRIYDEHLKSHEPGYVKQLFPCTECDRTFSAIYLLNAHVKAIHLGIRRTYVCPTCGMVFYRKETLLVHESSHTGIKLTSLGKHHKFKHDANYEALLCHLCDKTFVSAQSLQGHMNARHAAGSKTFTCAVCGKSFFQKQALTRHERVHTGAKPFTCNQCEKSFNDSSIIRRHMILTHKWDPKKWRECVISTGNKNY